MLSSLADQKYFHLDESLRLVFLIYLSHSVFFLPRKEETQPKITDVTKISLALFAQAGQ